MLWGFFNLENALLIGLLLKKIRKWDFPFFLKKIIIIKKHDIHNKSLNSLKVVSFG